MTYYIFRFLFLALFALPTLAHTVSEQEYPLAHDFKEIIRQEEYPKESGYFHYIYYKNKQLCRCDASSLFVSPQGQYAVYQKELRAGKNNYDFEYGFTYLFNTKTQASVLIPMPKHSTKIDSVEWQDKKAIVYFFSDAGFNFNLHTEITLQ